MRRSEQNPGLSRPSLIRHRGSDLIKIGITSDWTSMAYALKVEHKCDALLVVACHNAFQEEQRLHAQFGEDRLSQSE